ncbi:MAG: cell division protein FtsQ/DivIB [Candidatus Delongbacteria bacterium]|nr:cell division protein FtsQ/DivIB [Candidatus Delongbacteria bacterium]MCG2760881.1 cell division protein FtsQ/DivIB [Candidatus Delongbacteria bacterium]
MNFIKRLYERLKTITIWTLAVIGMLLLVFSAYYTTELYSSTTIFNLKKIIVRNQKILSAGDVIELSQIKRGVRIMDIDTKSAIRRMNVSPYITASRIDLVYPATIVIKITENRPIAYLNIKNELKFVDGKGIVMGKAKPKSGYDLPIISSDSDDNIIKFLNMSLKISPFVYYQISEIESSKSGLELYLNKSGARIIVGEGDFEKKIIVLENFLKEEYGNISFKIVDYIDLRFDKQVIMKEFDIADK